MHTDNDRAQAWMPAVRGMVDRGFVFVHINKTGGSSVRAALGLDGYRHVRASELAAFIGERAWKRLTTFSTVRNPWDRLVSMYHWRIKTNQTDLGSGEIGFSQWLDLCLRNRDSFYIKNPLMLAPQSYWLCDDSGRLLVAKLLRFERLAEDFTRLCFEIGLDAAELPHLKKTERKHYSAYFSERDADLVGRIYRDDINAFGYRFEREPARGRLPSDFG